MEGILKDFPNIDSVITASMQKSFNLFDPTPTSPEVLVGEMSTDLTATTVFVQ